MKSFGKEKQFIEKGGYYGLRKDKTTEQAPYSSKGKRRHTQP